MSTPVGNHQAREQLAASRFERERAGAQLAALRQSIIHDVRLAVRALEEGRSARHLGLVLAATLLWSPFVTVGLVPFALAALGVAIVGPIVEELLFRGFVQRIFARNMSGALAVALAGVLFGLSHFSIAVLPGVVSLGVLYGYIYHATRSLWCPIMAHAVFNFSSLLRLHAATEEEIISAAVELPGIALTLLSLAACVVSLGLLRRAARAGGFHRRRA